MISEELAETTVPELLARGARLFGDALATALLFQRLLKKAEHRGIHTLGDLLAR